MALRRSLQAVYLLAASLAFVQGKDAQLCSPCQTSADCGPIGSHTTLPDIIGGLPKGHILAAHFPTVCHHRSCVPLQVPSKDAFCRELSQALQTEEQQRQQQAGRGAHGLTLSKIAHSLAEPVKVHLGGRKAFSGRPAARRLTQDSSPLPGAGTMGSLPAGETMNTGGVTATETAVNTNSKGQLSAATTGTGSSVIYVPGIGYVTPVNGDGTTASPAAATKGMARQPMYQAPSTQASPAATGGITSQAGGQASAKNGASTSTTKTPTASTNAGDVQVAGTTDAAGDAGAMGGINSGTALQGGSGASTATGANAGLSTSQGAGYTSSGSKASGSKAAGSGSSGSPGSATGNAEEGMAGSIGSVGGGQPTGKAGNYQSGTSGEKGSASGATGEAGAAGSTAAGAGASGSASGSAGGTASKGTGASGTDGEASGASGSGTAGSSKSGSAKGSAGGTAGEGTGASGSGKAGSSGAGTGKAETGTAMGGSVGGIKGGQPTAVAGTYGSGKSVSGGQASTAGGGTNGGSSSSGSGSAGAAGGGAASTTGSGSSSSSGSGSTGGDQFSGQNAANQAGANLGTFNSQFGGGSSSNGGGKQQGASVTGASNFGSSNTGSGTRGASATGNPAFGPATSVAAETNSFMATSQAANSQGLNPETSTSTAPNTLQYSNGFVSFKADSDQVIPHTHNAAQCAQHCARSPDCVAWTRVAGGSKDVQTCYLKTSLDGSTNATPGGTTTMTQSGGAVQYSQPGTGNRQILESGTKDPKALPAALYGCPYPATSGGECKPPPSCNCYNGVCYGSCQ